MPVYQPLIPTGTVNLDEDYQNLQGNFEQANIVYGEDHFAFDNATVGEQGFHDKVTMPVRADPTSIASQGIVYTKDSANQPGRSDLYYAYQTDAGTPYSGTFFPLNACKAFGKIDFTTGLVAGSSFNVASAALVLGLWEVNFTSAVVAVGEEAKMLVMLGDQSTAAINASSYSITNPSKIKIRFGSSVLAVSFWVVAI